MAIHLPREGVRELIAEIDGTLLPIVEIGEAKGDRRRQRSCKWQQARLCLAGQWQSVRRRYEATLGNVESAGRLGKVCVAAAGAGQQTHLHCVGDGARWIVLQVKEQFGEQATFWSTSIICRNIWVKQARPSQARKPRVGYGGNKRG